MLKNIKAIKFCDNTSYQINDFKLKKTIIDYILNQINTSFLQEKEINNESILKHIKSKNYKAFYLPNYNNYILLLKEINNIYYSILIKNNFELNLNSINYNNLEIYHLDIIFPKNYYKGTILNTFLTKNESNSILNIYDLLYFEGNLVNFNLDEKKTIIKLIISDLDTKYFQFNIINYLNLNELNNSDNIHGIIFISYLNDIKYIIKKKNKYIKEYSNLYMKKLNTDVFNLYCNDNENKKKIGLAHIPNINTSLCFNKYNDEIVVKCWYNKKFNKWVPFELVKEDNITNYKEIVNISKKL